MQTLNARGLPGGHSSTAGSAGVTSQPGARSVSEEAVAAARGAASKDPKVAAALLFVAKLIQQRGKLPPTEVAGLRTAGHSDTEIVEIVATAVLSLFRDYVNLVAGTEIEDVTKLRDTGLTVRSAES